MKLPYKRFVKQVSIGASFPRAQYVAMMDMNAISIQSAKWREADQNPQTGSLVPDDISLTDGACDEDGMWVTMPTYTSYINDRYDAYAQAGDYIPRMGTMCAYLGCVAYRFMMPQSNGGLTSAKIKVMRSRSMRAGVRLTIISGSESDPNGYGWDEIRGDVGNASRTESTVPEQGIVGVASWGFLNQKNAKCMILGTDASAVWNAPVEHVSSTDEYLWIFMTLEDPNAYWDMYTSIEQRYYYIEGSAMIVPMECDFTFADSSVVPPDGPAPWYLAKMHDSSSKSIDSYLEDSYAEMGVVPEAAPVSAIFVCDKGAASSDFGVFSDPMDAAVGSAFMFNQDGSETNGYYSNEKSLIDMVDINKMASIRGPGDFGLFAMARKCRIKIGNSGNIYLDSGKAMLLGYLPVDVPLGSMGYTKMKITCKSGAICAGMSAYVNVWRIKDISAIGPFDWLVLCAMAKDMAFFTAENNSISGQVPMDQDFKYSVSAKAELIGMLDIKSLDSNTVSAEEREFMVDIQSGVNPGDMIVLVPNITRVHNEIGGLTINGFNFPEEVRLLGNVDVVEDFNNMELYKVGDRIKQGALWMCATKYEPSYYDEEETYSVGDIVIVDGPSPTVRIFNSDSSDIGDTTVISNNIQGVADSRRFINIPGPFVNNMVSGMTFMHKELMYLCTESGKYVQIPMEFSSYVAYKSGDIVSRDGLIYMCRSLKREGQWDEDKFIKVPSQFDAAKLYYPGDSVFDKRGNTEYIYICYDEYDGQKPFAECFSEFNYQQGEQFPIFSPGGTYSKGALVMVNDSLYVCIASTSHASLGDFVDTRIKVKNTSSSEFSYSVGYIYVDLNNKSVDVCQQKYSVASTAVSGDVNPIALWSCPRQISAGKEYAVGGSLSLYDTYENQSIRRIYICIRGCTLGNDGDYWSSQKRNFMPVPASFDYRLSYIPGDMVVNDGLYMCKKANNAGSDFGNYFIDTSTSLTHKVDPKSLSIVKEVHFS